MFKYFIILLFSIICISSYGQQAWVDSNNAVTNRPNNIKRKPAHSYIGFSAGVNNPAGLIGFDFNIPVKKYVMLCGGLGFSTWGNKLHFEGKYFVKPHHLGFAVSAGIAFNSGVENFNANLETVNQTKERVTINMHPLSTIFMGAYHYWKLGKGPNRFFMLAGWDSPLTQPQYDIIYNGPQLTDRSKNYMRHREPGGVMMGIGFSFGLHH